MFVCSPLAGWLGAAFGWLATPLLTGHTGEPAQFTADGIGGFGDSAGGAAGNGGEALAGLAAGGLATVAFDGNGCDKAPGVDNLRAEGSVATATARAADAGTLADFSVRRTGMREATGVVGAPAAGGSLPAETETKGSLAALLEDDVCNCLSLGFWPPAAAGR